LSDRPNPTLGVVVGHGEMAQGLIDAVRRIAGDAADALIAISNEGKSPAELKADLDRIVDGAPALVFTDLPSGSCGLAALSCCRGSESRAVVCGVNLPILLDFVFHRDVPLDELVSRLVEKGREGIRPLPGQN
jgi:mannose/fructose-specific phosphotransferase system component IIA